MTWNTDQYVPPRRVIASVVAEAVVPVLAIYAPTRTTR